MTATYIHLSDIHFGQEKGGDINVNDDVKRQLLHDARKFIVGLDSGSADGIIISGDIAYGGKPKEYENAGQWLDQLTTAVGCDITAVQVVPGNHDIDRDKITTGTQVIIEDIINRGDKALDSYIEKDEDRELLYNRFSGYRTFAEGYNCSLDNEGLISGHRSKELAPNKIIKFHGLNTALICSKSDKENGGLLLGKRQRVIRVEENTEIVVIAHHPLHWLQDSEDAKKYIDNRARVFISGHEHSPSHKLVNIREGVDILMIASGATVPPNASKKFNYSYNILVFSYVEESNGLKVEIHGRHWNDDQKAFDPDCIHFENGYACYNLNCPNFDKNKPVSSDNRGALTKQENDYQEISENAIKIVQEIMSDDKEYGLVLLKFFRDLSAAQRLTILAEFKAIPEDWTDFLSHSLERRALDKLVEKGQLEALHDKINSIINPLGR